MTEIERLLSELSLTKELIKSTEEALDEFKRTEGSLRQQVFGLMVDNDLDRSESPDGNWVAVRTKRKKYAVDDERGLVSYLMEKRPELLKPDLVATKKQIGKDPGITVHFILSVEESLVVSAVKEEIPMEETPQQFRERVRKSQEQSI